MIRSGALWLTVSLVCTAASAQAQTVPPIPKPFPTAGARPVTPSPQTVPDDARELPAYPAATFLETIDAGKGQQYYLYGTDTPYEDIVTYYKTTLNNGGRVIFQGPMMHQFELGRFREETMAYPPSVVVKDYTWDGAEGYLHVLGTTSVRYRTIIQIVPAQAR
ncbi:MAG: hypothetical protein HQ485_02090 [Acidobacteria bacterium]|jgi:hypothetical protein|nr:hypothetical protein [Acidobacteriota bacterium]